MLAHVSDSYFYNGSSVSFYDLLNEETEYVLTDLTLMPDGLLPDTFPEAVAAARFLALGEFVIKVDFDNNVTDVVYVAP